MKVPELVAHRGYTRHYPENTLLAIDGAIAAGARYIEVDVQLSRDGVPVLFHDATLERLCGIDGGIHDYTAGDLAQYRVRDAQRFGARFDDAHIATLAQLTETLSQHEHVTAFIELKRIALRHAGISAMLASVHAALAPVLNRCVLISYSLEALRDARGAGWPALGAVIDSWDERTLPVIADIAPQYLFCDVDGLPPTGDLRADPAKVVVFEVADAAIALALAARGVDLIETFAVGEMMQALDA